MQFFGSHGRMTEFVSKR